MISKILIAIDHSLNNNLIFDQAVALAQNTGADLMLLHVMSKKDADFPALPSFTYSDYPLIDDRAYDAYQKQMNEYQQWWLNYLQDLTNNATASGVQTEFTQLTGNPGKLICELANNWSADLIMVGSRGLKGLKEMFLGSVSNYVTHHASCAVLIVRNPIDSKSNRSLSEVAKADNQQLDVAK